MPTKEEIIKAIQELKAQKKRDFEQSIDLIINLKKIDLKKTSINLFINLPHRIKEKKICAFLTKKNKLIDTITKEEFSQYEEKKQIKKLVKKYGFFIAHASLMPTIATKFGKFLGTAGKMPSPQLGILTEESDNAISQLIEKINSNIRIKAKEPSIKLCIGREGMKESDTADNILAVYNTVLNVLPDKKENVNSILLKLTMTKPKKLEIK